MQDLLYRAYNAMRWGQSVEEVRDLLIRAGLNEYQAWLTYKGALLLIQNP